MSIPLLGTVMQGYTVLGYGGVHLNCVGGFDNSIFTVIWLVADN